VADTVPAGTGGANPPIGAFNRQYGSAPDPVAQDIATVVGAAQSAGVLTTLKHFPGLGRVRANTDTSTQAVDPVTTVADPYLRPGPGAAPSSPPPSSTASRDRSGPAAPRSSSPRPAWSARRAAPRPPPGPGCPGRTAAPRSTARHR